MSGGDFLFHQWIGAEKQLSVTVEKGMGGKYSHKISYGGKVEDRDDILKVLDEVDKALSDRYGSQAA